MGWGWDRQVYGDELGVCAAGGDTTGVHYDSLQGVCGVQT